MSVVALTLWPLHPWRKDLSIPTKQQTASVRFGEEKNVLSLASHDFLVLHPTTLPTVEK
jgi:hypothetical protein